MIKVFEAFAGIGTQHMALKRLGIPFEVVAVAEIDAEAYSTYQAIHGETINLGDIRFINIEDVPDHDLFTYSFPCTDLSRQGREEGLTEGSNTASSLLWECKKIISSKKPKYLLMENVKPLVGKKFKPEFDVWCQWLESQGYSSKWQVVNAKDGFIPQNRERVFLVSELCSENEFTFDFPVGSNKTKLEDILELDGFLPMYHNIYGGFKEKKARIFSEYSPTIRCAKGGGHLPSVGSYTMGTKEVEGVSIRQITPLEAWRLMDISDEDFYKAKATGISNTTLYNQAGNAIVVSVLEGIFRNLLIK